MSKRYYTKLNNPELTIELLDDTANRIKFEREIEPDSIAKIGNQILELNLELESLKLEDDKSQNINILKLRVEKLTKKYEIITSQWKRERDNIKIIMKLQKHVNDITEKIYHYKSVNNFVEAGRLLYLELPKYKQQLDQLEQQTKYEYINLEIQNKDILITISKKTGIGIEQLSHDAQSIFQLKNFLLQNIVGQDKAIHDICQQLKRVFGGFRNANRPLSVMCFTGPTGVGKTKMAELIGEFLFNNKDCVKIINMAQYQERHNTSGLFGTTAGYVGYKEEGILTGAVRIRPYQVILLDELEKAHPSIFDTLLAIFDKGIIEDNAGRITSFREAIIIITMNVYNLQTQINDDENHMYNSLIIEMKKKFNPEFIGRIDSIVLFNTIGQKHYDTIIRRQVIQEINSFHKNTGINIVIEEQVYDYFVKFHSKFTLGVRDINKTLQDNLYVKIIDVACDIPSNLKKSSTLVVQFCNGDIHVQLSNNTNLLQN
jgi:ATP-dependent Clp protease ATP-binding subunit ClpB